MNTTNLECLNEFFGARGVTAALLANPWTIAWLTGYAPPIQTGPSPFEGGPALAWWDGGELILIASDAEAGSLRGLGVEVREYAGYTIDEPLDVVVRQAAALRELLGGWRGRRATVAVELRFLPAALAGIVHESLSGATLQPVDGQLEPLRAVKTPEEIAKLRAALALCDQSQADVRMLLQPGVSEISLWGELKAGLEVQAGGRLPMLADLVAGIRTGEMGGLPGAYVLQEGDPVIADIVPRLDGYWGDICGTHFVGAPPAEMAKIRGIVHDALRRGMDAVRPGVIARDLDAMLRETIRATGHEPHPHHSGHGVGVSYHEEPRLVPYNAMALAPGMVVAIEPGIYLPGVGGVRLENVVLVTQDGCEVLTKHLGH
jgi:Xaa-Pro aminopeptidase